TVLAEAACDETVLKSGCDPERYASTLIAFAHLGRIRGVSGVDVAQLRLPGPQLTTRIRSILAGSRSPAPSAFRLTLGAVVGALVFSLFAIGVPVHGQTTDLAFDVTSIKPNTQHFIDLGNGLRLLRGETRCNAADSAVLPGDPIPRPGVG